MSHLALDRQDRERLTEHYHARIAELHLELEKLVLTRKKTQQHRGAIAELRRLISELDPKTSATIPPKDPRRPPLY